MSFEIVLSAGAETGATDAGLVAPPTRRYPIPSPAAVTPATTVNPAHARQFRPGAGGTAGEDGSGGCGVGLASFVERKS